MKLLKILLSIPKTICFDFHHLPLQQAYKLPIWISYNVKIKMGGKILLNNHNNIKTAMVRIGFHEVPVCGSQDQTLLKLAKNGKLIFNGTAHIGHGTKIYVAEGGQLHLGNNFAISASSQINCYKKITFGNDIQFSWNCLIMDSDNHKIFDENGNIINKPREIVFGDKVWIGCRTTILKGSVIPSNCVIGACSLVSGKKFENDSIIVGNPAKSIKKISKWEL